MPTRTSSTANGTRLLTVVNPACSHGYMSREYSVSTVASGSGAARHSTAMIERTSQPRTGSGAMVSRRRIVRDQPHRSLVSHVRERPLRHHRQPVAEADELEDVKSEPEPPGEIALQPQPTEIAHRRVAADGRHVAEIAVAERVAWLAAPRADDVQCRQMRLLQRN